MMDGETGVTRFFSPALQEEVITGFSTVPEVGVGRDDPPTAVGTRSPRESGPARGVVGDWHGAALRQPPWRPRVTLAVDPFAPYWPGRRAFCQCGEARASSSASCTRAKQPPWLPSSTAWRMK